MAFVWDERAIRWRLDASDYTGYDAAMAALLLPKLEGCATLCDVGCGLGLVDLALAEHLESVTGVDVSAPAIDTLRRRADRAGIRNVTALRADRRTLRGAWDAVLVMFCGAVEETVPACVSLARRRVLLVVHSEAYGGTGPEAYRRRKRTSAESAGAWLDANGYRYSAESAALEFGQPHADFDDALAFLRVYCPDAPEEALARHLRGTLRQTGRADFPLYAPKTKRFTVFNIDARRGEENVCTSF